MRYAVCSVYDSKARAFSAPFFSVNLQVAVRSFADVCNNPGTVLNTNPEDFTLYHLGEWEDNKATFEPFTPPTNLGLAANFLNNQGLKLHVQPKDA